MSVVQIVKAYPKEGNAVFKLESDNGNPLHPVRTCFVTKPIRLVESPLEDYVGMTFPGRIVFDEMINPNPKSVFNLSKRTSGDQVTFYLVYKGTDFVGYLERHWRYTKSNRSDYKISRTEFEIRPNTKSSSAWKLALETKLV